MNSEIERLDKRRMRTLEWYLVGLVIFLILWIVRYYFRLQNLNTQPVGRAVFWGLVLSVLVLAISSLETARIGRRIKKDPVLKEALYNEMVRTIEAHSWRSAYLAAIATTAFFAVSEFFYPVCDPVLVALTATIVGFGAHQATFYIRYRSS